MSADSSMRMFLLPRIEISCDSSSVSCCSLGSGEEGGDYWWIVGEAVGLWFFRENIEFIIVWKMVDRVP